MNDEDRNTEAPGEKAVMRAATELDIDPICSFLALNMERGITASQYRRIFFYPWRPEGAHLGLLLEAKGKVVGFFGGIWSDRIIEGEPHRVCNLTNWCVLPAFRTQSLPLFFSMLSKKDCLYTDLSPIPIAEKLLQKCNFRMITKYKQFTAPFVHLPGLLRSLHTTVKTEGLEMDLTEPEMEIWRSHQSIGCRH